MLTKHWDDLPDFMKCDEVKHYYDILDKKRKSLYFKRLFDIVFAVILTVLLLPIMLVIAVIIAVDSPGCVLFRQERVTTNGKIFKIYKFRTMKSNINGSQITYKDDERITKVGHILRKYRLDEIVQLFNVYSGDMTFVGTRPEVPKYVNQYTSEMRATLLLPAGVMSITSLKYKNESLLIVSPNQNDSIYTQHILPEKMMLNLRALQTWTFYNDVKVIFLTIVSFVDGNAVGRFRFCL
ncbi:glycosyl transferase [Clostridia bacterium]|nr:glycosyl transferase [Clostridia bacterium]